MEPPVEKPRKTLAEHPQNTRGIGAEQKNIKKIGSGVLRGLRRGCASASASACARGTSTEHARSRKMVSAGVPRRFCGGSAKVPRDFRRGSAPLQGSVGVLRGFGGGSTRVPRRFRGGGGGSRRFRGGSAEVARGGSAGVPRLFCSKWAHKRSNSLKNRGSSGRKRNLNPQNFLKKRKEVTTWSGFTAAKHTYKMVFGVVLGVVLGVCSEWCSGLRTTWCSTHSEHQPVHDSEHLKHQCPHTTNPGSLNAYMPTSTYMTYIGKHSEVVFVCPAVCLFGDSDPERLCLFG